MTKKADLKRAKNEKEGKRIFTNPLKQEKDQKRKKEKGCLPNLKSRRGIEKKKEKESLPILQSRKRIKRERKKEKERLPILQSRKRIKRERKDERKRKFTNPQKQEAATDFPSRQLAF